MIAVAISSRFSLTPLSVLIFCTSIVLSNHNMPLFLDIVLPNGTFEIKSLSD